MISFVPNSSVHLCDYTNYTRFDYVHCFTQETVHTCMGLYRTCMHDLKGSHYMARDVVELGIHQLFEEEKRHVFEK